MIKRWKKEDPTFKSPLPDAEEDADPRIKLSNTFPATLGYCDATDQTSASILCKRQLHPVRANFESALARAIGRVLSSLALIDLGVRWLCSLYQIFHNTEIPWGLDVIGPSD